MLARDKFELISQLEYIDLERLQADRNRCAHPSLVSEEQAYTPSAELARAHIHAAVTHSLQHAPAQGKYALDRLVKEVDSEFFPTEVPQAITAFSSGPLRKPRDSLTRNFTVVLIKRLIKEDNQSKERQRVVAALRAIAAIHPAQYNAALNDKLTPLLRTLEDGELLRATQFIERVPDCWQFIEENVRQRLTGFVTELPADALEDMGFLLVFEPLRTAAEERIQLATLAELKPLIFFDLPTKVADRLVTLYLQSKSFDQANVAAKELALYARDLTADHIRRIVLGAQKNEQILSSFELRTLLAALRVCKKIPQNEFDQLLNANGLSQYVPAAPQNA